jgi:hypothetical protein
VRPAPAPLELARVPPSGLLVIHIPLAMLVFGLAIWLSAKARGVRRAAGG